MFVALLVVYVVAGTWTTRRVSATGDEPYYFMTADALLHGEGLDLTRRWMAIDGASYDPTVPIPRAELERSTAPSRIRDGAYPLHDLATSFLIAPALALGGRALVVAVIAAAMAAAVALGHRAARTVGTAPPIALAAALAVGMSAPALTYSGQVFGDSLAPFALALGLCGFVGALPSGLIGVAAAILVLLHVRFWPVALVLIGVPMLRTHASARRILMLLAPLAVAVLALSTVDLVTYGLPLPHAGFLLFFMDRPAAHVASYARATPIEGSVGLFVDRAFGLVPAAPLAALLFAGAGRLARDPRLRSLLAIPVPYLALVSLLDWTGGFSPQARYFAVFVPLFVLLMARALEWRPALLLAIPLGVWTVATSAIFVVAPWLRYDGYAVPPLADLAWIRVAGVTPSAVFPLFGTDGAPFLALCWSLLLAALFLAAFIWPGRSGRQSRQSHRAATASLP